MESQFHRSPSQSIDFFSRSLESFASSASPFRVLHTLPSHRPTPTSQREHGHGGGERILVLDSSFNPPTTAHAHMARSAIRWARTQHPSQQSVRLMLLLAVNNADKEAKPAGFAQRLCMMDMFGRMVSRESEGEDGEVEIELAVTTMPYFADKARAILQTCLDPLHSTLETETETETETELVFLVGFDTITRIFHPKYYTSSGGMRTSLGPFFQRARLRVTCRPAADGEDGEGSRAQQEAYVRALEGALPAMGGDAAWAGKIDLEDARVGGEVEAGRVSSSRVREMVKAGEMGGLKDLVDEGVRDWIEREGLYR